MTKLIYLKPRVSEKTYGLSISRNTYVFNVPKSANKMVIKQAVQDQFKVIVTDVNVAIAKGKAKQTYRRGGRPLTGRTTDIKKAFVTLKEGDTLPFFASVEPEQQPILPKKESK